MKWVLQNNIYKGDMQRVIMAIEDWAECPNGLLW